MALVTVTPTVTATVGGHITAGSLSILANANLNNGNSSATAFAGGSTGGIVAVVASDAEATDNATVNAGIGDFGTKAATAMGTVLAVNGAILVVANGNTQQRSTGSNSSIGLVALGVAKATSTASNTTKATVGSSAQVTADTMQVNANGNDNNLAETIAGSGGVLAGAAAAPSTSDTATVTATIGAGANIDVIGGTIHSAFGNLGRAYLHRRHPGDRRRGRFPFRGRRSGSQQHHFERLRRAGRFGYGAIDRRPRGERLQSPGAR